MKLIGIILGQYKSDLKNLNFKARKINSRGNLSEVQHKYRGMMFNGLISSARYLGNYAPGYLVDLHNFPWVTVRLIFDGFQASGNMSITKGVLKKLFSKHYISDHQNSINTQYNGYQDGIKAIKPTPYRPY